MRDGCQAGAGAAPIREVTIDPAKVLLHAGLLPRPSWQGLWIILTLMHVTVAIATWNRAVLLSETLSSLALLRVPSDVTWEIVVCDNNSTDGTRDIIENAARDEKLVQQTGCDGVRYLFEEKQGKSHALNRILREAKGAWVCFIDDDVVVEPDWLEVYVRAMASHPRAAVFGGQILPRVSRPLSIREAFLLKHYPGAYGVTNIEADRPIAPPASTPGGANMALRRDVALQLLFDPDRGMIAGQRIAGEDAGMALRIVEEGHEGWMLADSKVLHHTPDNFIGVRRLWEWQRGIGRTWVLSRGKPTPGKFGIAWWAWREMVRRYLRMWLCWRPSPNKSYYDAMVAAAQYWGYLRAK